MVDLIPSFLKRRAEPEIISTTTLESCINGNCKTYTIHQTKDDSVIVEANLYGKKKIMTLPGGVAKKIQDLVNTLDISSLYTRSPFPPLLLTYKNPDSQLQEIERYRKELDQFEEQVKKYAEQRKDEPQKRVIYLDARQQILSNLDKLFIGATR